jgi:hypothetical protein
MGWMMMRASDLYVINFRSTISSETADTLNLIWGAALTQRELEYPTYDPSKQRFVNPARLANALEAVFNANYEKSGLAIIAFVVAEALRFDLVRNTVDVVLDVAPRYFNSLNWDYFLPVLQDWSKMSMKYHGVKQVRWHHR